MVSMATQLLEREKLKVGREEGEKSGGRRKDEPIRGELAGEKLLKIISPSLWKDNGPTTLENFEDNVSTLDEKVI